MDPDQNGMGYADRFAFRIELTDIAHAQGDMRLGIERGLVGVQRPIAPGISQRNGFDSHHRTFALKAIFNQGFDRADLQVVPFGEANQIGKPGDLAVFVQDFDDEAGGCKTRHPSQVDAGLGVTGADEDAAGLALERADVAGPMKVGWPGRVVEAMQNRAATIRRADAGRHAEFARRIDRDGERGSMGCGVFVGLGIEVEPFADFAVQRQAELARRLSDHEVDHLGCGAFGGADEITFILTILVVDQDDESPGAHVLDHVGNGAGTGRFLETFVYSPGPGFAAPTAARARCRDPMRR